MASESDLRHRFRDPESPGGTIDVDAVIRRSRARRRPRAILAASASTLAAAAIVVPLTLVGIGSISPTNPDATLAGGAAESATDSGLAEPDAAIDRAPVSRVNLCEGELTQLDTPESGLAIALPATVAEAGPEPVDIVVTLVNTSDTELRGSVIGTAALTVSEDGMVVWHSNGPSADASERRAFTLAPGESTTFPAQVELVRCAIEDDEGDEFRSELPPLEPGDYTLTALLEIELGADAEPVLVGSAATPIRVE